MSDTYNNVPMSDSMAARTEKEDAFWTGPKLIGLSFVTLGLCFALLWRAFFLALPIIYLRHVLFGSLISLRNHQSNFGSTGNNK